METEWLVSRVELYQTWRQHPHWSTAQLAEAVKRSVSWVKKWLRRFREAHPLTAEVFQSRSRRPKQIRASVHPTVVEAILSLRDSLSEQYHRRAGAALILYHLHRDEVLKAEGYWLPRSTKTIRRILKAHGRIRPKPVIIHVPVERPAPMVEWELDFAQTRQGGEDGAEFLAVVDRGTSILVHTEARPAFHAHTALQSITKLFLLKGLPQRLRFDRDSRLFGSWTRDSYPSPLVRFLHCLGIEPVICPPRRPDLKPFVERGIRTLKEECIEVLRPDNIPLLNSQLEEYGYFYNSQRPHQGLSCDNKPPYVALPQLPTLPELPDTVDPDRWLQSYHGRVFRRRVNANGSVMIDRYRYYPGKAYAGQLIAFHLDARQQLFRVQLNGRVIAQFAVQGLHTTHLPLQDYLGLMMHEAQSIEQYRLRHWMKNTTQTLP